MRADVPVPMISAPVAGSAVKSSVMFTFNSSVHERTYVISANADISALLGLVRWNGVTRVSGALASNTPRPAGYSFEYRGSSKSGSVRMVFGNGAVKGIDFNPPLPDQPGTVPVQPAHMRGVLDPLSAVLALSRPKDGNPCNQRAAVFDGKARFDLTLQAKGEAPIHAAGGRVQIWIAPTNEEIVVARQAQELLT